MSHDMRSMQDMFNGTPIDLLLSPTPLQIELTSLRSELEAAKAEIADFESDIDTCTGHNVELQQQLAAQELVIQQVHMQLEACYNGLRWWMDVFPLHVTEADNEEMLELVKVLSLAPSTSHLDAYVAEAVRKENEECAKVCDCPDGDGNVFADDCAAAIRERMK